MVQYLPEKGEGRKGQKTGDGLPGWEKVRYGATWCDTVRYDTVQHGATRCGNTVRCGMVRRGAVWCDVGLVTTYTCGVR